MKTGIFARVTLLTVALAGCASTAGNAGPNEAGPLGPGEGPSPTVVTQPEPTSAASPSPAPACADLVRPGVVRRAAIARVVDAGLGRWLAGVDVERRLEKGRFRGWAVRRLYPGDPCYGAVDIKPDDVVLTVNGRNIERPDAAHDVFASLKSAPAIVVRYLRAGEERTVTYEIAD